MRTMSFIILFLVLLFSCKKESSNNYEYVYNNDYIRDTILVQINKGIIGPKHQFIVNERLLDDSEINSTISSINVSDIISISFIDKITAVDSYSSSATDGIVKINYYVDPLLKPEYYTNIDNTYIMGIINALIIQNKVVRYPLIVLDGYPLRGLDIKSHLDNLDNGSIKSILVMNLDSGLQLYGDRAINGVVIINTLY